MVSDRTLFFFGGGGVEAEPPDFVREFSERRALKIVDLPTAQAVHSAVNRSFPACLILDLERDQETALNLCAELKRDHFTAIVPVVMLVGKEDRALSTRGLEVGADEVIPANASDRERVLRMDLLLRRAIRDVSVHPTTHLPGTVQIERDLARRLESGERFAACYADLDHFKEFNDRYGYTHGDRVILLVSWILRDLVRALAPGGFVGHIGGDDFLFTVQLDQMESVCDAIVDLFDELIPYQYTPEDRRAGYFLGKDRRGNVHRIPIMTLSIGVVTNQFQHFIHTAQVSALAGEMKTYAKTHPGSVYVVDRRQVEGRDEETSQAPRPGDLRRPRP